MIKKRERKENNKININKNVEDSLIWIKSEFIFL